MEKKKGKLNNPTSPFGLRGTSAKPRVAVAMSGGVDSSVAAKILVDQGYDVVGFMMKLWSDPNCPSKCPRENACCDEQGIIDAKKVADQLKIPFYLLDVREKFKKGVTDYFIEEYKNLRTPNPCVVCNEKIKFGWLLKFTKSVGCQYLATGHYARIAVSNSGSSKLEILNPKQILNSNYQKSKPVNQSTSQPVNFYLLRAKDKNKDQSYFLYRLNQDQLSKIIFPVGEYMKEEVRAMARKWKLPVYQKRESQEICFVEDKDFRDFLRRNIPKKYFKAGEIVDTRGNVLGKHEGLVNYTIGQRKRVNQELGIMNYGGNKSPLYVVGFDKKENQLIVGKDQDVYRNEMTIEDVHFIQNKELGIRNRNNSKLQIKIRYRHPAVRGKALIHNSKFIIRFKKPQRAITPGQSAVFYLGDEVLGGGIIQ